MRPLSPRIIKKHTYLLGLIALAGALLPTSRAAQPTTLQLAPIFADGMVLQRNKPTAIWGHSSGKTVTVALGQERARARVSPSGNWKIFLPPQEAGGPHSIAVTAGDKVININDVYFGEVWLAGGQSNMRVKVTNKTELAKSDPLLRYYNVPLLTHPSVKIKANAVMGWRRFEPGQNTLISAVGYAFARELRRELDVPVALLQCNYGGSTAEAWMSRETLQQNPYTAEKLASYDSTMASKSLEEHAVVFANWEKDFKAYQQVRRLWNEAGKKGPEPKRPPTPAGPFNQQRPTSLYEAMLQRIAGYTIRGFLFYQGEANAHDQVRYADTMTGLIADWREDWGDQELPFFFVQLPGYGSRVAKKHWPGLREGQRQADLRIPGTGMAVTIDLGDEHDIHPTDKNPVGQRLALLALHDVYGFGLAARSPQPGRATFVDGEVRVSFSETASGLRLTDGQSVRGFEVTGSDGKTHPVQAVITGPEEVTLRLPSHAILPHTIRYCWVGWPEPKPNLINSAGLPAIPFHMPVTTNEKDLSR